MMTEITDMDKASKKIDSDIQIQGKIVGDLLFASGQIPHYSKTGEIVGAMVEEQIKQVLSNIRAFLEEAGTNFDHVVKATCSFSNEGDFATFSEFYQTVFTRLFPNRFTVEVAHLPKNVKIEIEVVVKLTR